VISRLSVCAAYQAARRCGFWVQNPARTFSQGLDERIAALLPNLAIVVAAPLIESDTAVIFGHLCFSRIFVLSRI
jgi:hypothetical protein